MIKYPSALDIKKPLIQGTGYQEGDSRAVHEFNGRILTRKRPIRANDQVSVAFHYTLPELEIFNNFYNDDLEGGVLEFEFSHPFLLTPLIVKFNTNPQVVPIGPVDYNVSFNLFVIDRNP